jgi:hypothetical protein
MPAMPSEVEPLLISQHSKVLMHNMEYHRTETFSRMKPFFAGFESLDTSLS